MRYIVEGNRLVERPSDLPTRPLNPYYPLRRPLYHTRRQPDNRGRLVLMTLALPDARGRALRFSLRGHEGPHPMDSSCFLYNIVSVNQMSTQNPRRRGIREVIKAGVLGRGFHIVPGFDHIPGCKQREDRKAGFIQRFARRNGWRATIHNINGWVLFTAREIPSAKDVEIDLGRVQRMTNLSLTEKCAVRNRAPISRIPSRFRE